MTAGSPGPLTEWLADHTKIEYVVKEVLYSGRSDYQQIDIVDLAGYGRALFLDHVIQTVEQDEFVYHEALVQPAMLTHGSATSVLIIGGGDGGALREVLRHRSVDRVVLAELDPEVISASARHLPFLGGAAFKDSRTEIIHGDARALVETRTDIFDVIIIDLTEPVEDGPSRLLFTQEFYEAVVARLGENGVVSVQAANVSPGHGDLLADILATLQMPGLAVSSFRCPMGSFFGDWGFVLASRGDNPADYSHADWADRLEQLSADFNYICSGTLAGGFSVPPYLRAIMETGKVRTDASPVVWSQ